ncbi:MAG: glycosyltransferase family 1 protein, partial [Candidatus Schekmanbacteria bacterium]
SGMSRMAEEEVRMLEEEGYEVTVFTPKDDNLITDIDIAGKVIRLKPFLRYGNGSFIPQFINKLSSFDVIHIHYPFIGAAEILLLWKKIFGRRKELFVTYQLDLQGNGILRGFFNLYNSLITPYVIKSSSTIMFTSMDYAYSSIFSNLFKKMAEEGKLRVVEIPGPVDIERFRTKEKRKDLLKKYNIEEDEKVALFVGSLDSAHYFKGIPVLLSAFEIYCRKFGDKKARILIGGDGNMKDAYIRQAKASEIIRDKVIFAGKVPEEELPDFYNLGSFVVLPSTDSSEAFGIVIVEGYASGIPALASNLPGVRSVIVDGETGTLCKAGDVEDLSSKLAFMFNEAPLIEWGKKSRQIAERKYSRKVVKKKFVSLFEKLQ